VLGLDRRAAGYTWTVLFILLLLRVVYLIRETLFVFAVALLFAYLLWPLVDYLDQRLPGRPRVLALAIVYCSLVGLLIVIGIEIGSRVVLQANALATRVPELLSKLEQPAEPFALPAVQTVKETLISALRRQLVYHSRELLSLLPNAALNVLSHAGSLFFIVLVPILSYFFLKDGRAIRSSLLGVLAEGSRRNMIQEIAADVHLLLAQYMRALVLLAAATFVAYGSFFSLIRVPYGILLAAIALPLAAAAIILIVAGLSGCHHLFWILVFLAVFRVFQDYVLAPHLLSAGTEIHPLVVIFGVLAADRSPGSPAAFCLYRSWRPSASSIASCKRSPLTPGSTTRGPESFKRHGRRRAKGTPVLRTKPFAVLIPGDVCDQGVRSTARRLKSSKCESPHCVTGQKTPCLVPPLGNFRRPPRSSFPRDEQF
jgi:predicted PurR-regulated permease PerM